MVSLLALGLSQDLYLGGVALSDGASLLFAANEERYSRIKNQGGFPHEALARTLELVNPAEITDVCICGITTPPLFLRLLPSIHSRIREEQSSSSASQFRRLADLMVHHTPVSSQRADSPYGRLMQRLLPKLMWRTLPVELRHARLHFAEHHACHAWGAYCQSGFDRALCITSDGMGDGISMSINDCNGTGITRLAVVGIRDSLGMFFEALTEAFGFVPSRDEGKITGLAAHGNAALVHVRSPFTVTAGAIQYSGPHGMKAVEWVKRELLGPYTREDVAAWAQEVLETSIKHIAEYWLRASAHERLVLSGGTAANVKLNQRLHELPVVHEIFVYPNMGDGGNAAGALAVCGFMQRQRVSHVFLGDSFTDRDYLSAIEATGVHARAMEQPARETAALLAGGHVVARFDGAMEWGPRALGNRSVLAPAGDPGITALLNEKLRRSDFMPFAPAILAEEASRWLQNYQAGLFAGEFMTVCFACSDEMKQKYPAVVHVDGTARAQIVREDCNPGLHDVLSEYAKLTGGGVLLNTSFNMHEEPIVRTPAEAIAAFQRGHLEYLTLGNYLVQRTC